MVSRWWTPREAPFFLFPLDLTHSERGRDTAYKGRARDASGECLALGFVRAGTH